jgi:hypothetical protein
MLAAGGAPVAFGIDFVAMRSNYHQLEQMCTDIAPRFPGLGFVWMGAAVPNCRRG